MRLLKNNEIRLLMILFVSAFLVTWFLPLGIVFAEEGEEEILLKELTGDEGSSEEEGNIEVLGFSEEQVPILNNRFLIVIIVLIVAAVGGLVLSFAIRGRT